MVATDIPFENTDFFPEKNKIFDQRNAK